MREFCEKNIGEISQISMRISKKKRNYGFAYVQLSNPRDMMAALALSGAELFGGNINVSQSNRPITEKKVQENTNREAPEAFDNEEVVDVKDNNYFRKFLQ